MVSHPTSTASCHGADQQQGDRYEPALIPHTRPPAYAPSSQTGSLPVHPDRRRHRLALGRRVRVDMIVSVCASPGLARASVMGRGDHHLQRSSVGCVTEDLVGLLHLLEVEVMGDQTACVELAGTDQSQQCGCRIGVDESGGDRHVADPQILEVSAAQDHGEGDQLPKSIEQYVTSTPITSTPITVTHHRHHHHMLDTSSRVGGPRLGEL